MPSSSLFNYVNYATPTADGQSLDYVLHPSKNMRFNLDPDQIITLTIGDLANLPGLADRYLGDMSLWWLLLEYNGIYDAIQDVLPGMKLRIPSRTGLIKYLETSPAAATTLVI